MNGDILSEGWDPSAFEVPHFELDEDPGDSPIDGLAGTTSLPRRPRLVPPDDFDLEEQRDRSRSPPRFPDMVEEQLPESSLFTETGFVSGEHFHAMAATAATTSAGHAVLKQPWESGVLAPIFEDKPKNPVDKIFGGYLKLPKIGLWESLEATNSPSGAVAHPVNNSVSVAVARRIKLAPLIKAERYRKLVLMDLGATKLGRSLTTFAGSLDLSQDLAQIFSDVFASN